MGATRVQAPGDRALVRLHGACKRYRWRSSWVLREVNLSVHPGSVIEVRGRNGAGKSTLLRMLAGATLPTRGERIAETDLAVGYGPERLAPAPPFPAAAYLAHHARIRRLRGEEGETRAAALAGRFGLESMLHEPLGTLSKGSLQKVVVIQALLGQPELVVLDEPFTGLDIEATHALCELIEEVTAAGSTVVFSDHRERDVRPRADVLWCVADGGVDERRVEHPADHVPDLPGVLETQAANGRLRVVVRSVESDRALAILVAQGWHVLAVQADAVPGQMRIDAAAPAGAP